MLNTVTVVLVTVMLAGVATTARVGAQSPAMRERIGATISALNGTPDDFEAYAQKAFAKAYLQKENAEKRKKFLETLRSGFGTLEAQQVIREDPTRVRIYAGSSKGKNVSLILEHETEAPHLITSLTIDEATERRILPATKEQR